MSTTPQATPPLPGAPAAAELPRAHVAGGAREVLLLAYPVLDEALGPREIAGVVAVTFGMVWALGLGHRWVPALKHAD